MPPTTICICKGQCLNDRQWQLTTSTNTHIHTKYQVCVCVRPTQKYQHSPFASFWLNDNSNSNSNTLEYVCCMLCRLISHYIPMFGGCEQCVWNRLHASLNNMRICDVWVCVMRAGNVCHRCAIHIWLRCTAHTHTRGQCKVLVHKTTVLTLTEWSVIN